MKFNIGDRIVVTHKMNGYFNCEGVVMGILPPNTMGNPDSKHRYAVLLDLVPKSLTYFDESELTPQFIPLQPLPSSVAALMELYTADLVHNMYSSFLGGTFTTPDDKPAVHVCQESDVVDMGFTHHDFRCKVCYKKSDRS